MLMPLNGVSSYSATPSTRASTGTERQAIFLGDFIDLGPQIRKTLEMVRPMVESGSALSVMGNHELNALACQHACWDETRMAKISGPVTDEFLHSACLPGGSLFEPVEVILKGKEARLPLGATFRDKDGQERLATRVKSYEPPDGHTYRSYAMASEPIESDLSLPVEVVQAAVPYPEDAKPVFVGHYWLSGSRPELLCQNIACVD